MNKKLSALLTTAVVSGLLAAQAGHAEETKDTSKGDAAGVEKQNCKTVHSENKDKKPAHKNKCGGKSKCGQKAEKPTEKPAEGK